MSLVEYAYFLHCQLCKHQKEDQEIEIKYDIKIDCHLMNLENSFKVFYEKTARENLINLGIDIANQFLNNNKFEVDSESVNIENNKNHNL